MQKTVLRTGKSPPRFDHRTLKFGSYLKSAMPPPPSAWDSIGNALSRVGSQSPGQLWPMDGNDKYGDCTIAAAAHATTLFSALAHQQNVIASAECVSAYMGLTGGQDTGLDVLTVLNWWRQTEFGGASIMGYAQIDPKNHEHVQQAIMLFGGVYVGMVVSATTLSDFWASKTWDVPVTLTDDGHAVFAASYDASGVTMLTWGSTQRATWAWWNACVDECYAVLPSQARAPGFAPAGLDFAALQADIAQLS